MAVNNRNRNRNAYGLDQALLNVPQQPIISQRAPTSNDLAEIGTIWIDVPNDDSYILTSIVANQGTWINTGGGGGAFASITTTGFVTVGTNLTVANNVTFSSFGRGMLQSDDAGVISSINGTNGQVLIGATGADAAWANLTSDGSVNFVTGVNSLELRVTGAAASTFPTDAGTATPVLGATNILGGTNINTAGAGQTVTINLDDNPSIAGGFTVTDGITTIVSDTDAANAIYLHANGGANETIRLYSDQGTSVNSVNLLSDLGGITLRSAGLATDDGINLESVAGGIDMDAALQINIDSSEVAIDAIRLLASDAAGGIDIDTGTGGITIDSTGAFSIDGAAASNVTVAGAGIDLTLNSTLGRVVINAEEAANDALRLLSAAGGLDLDVGLQMNLTGSQAAADAIRIQASDAAGGIDIDAGTGGIAVDTTGAISLDAAAASNFTATGAFDVTINSTAGSLILTGGQAAVDAIDINASDVAGGIDMDAGTGGITIDSTGAISIDSALASNFTITGAADLTLSTTLGSVVIDGGEAAIDAIQLTASDAGGGLDFNAGTGGITLDSTGAISIDAQAASNFTATGAFDVTIESTAGSVNLTGGEADPAAIALQAAAGGVDIDGALQVNIASSQAAVDAIRINASDAAGGIDIDDAGGGITIDSAAGISIDAATASNFSAAAGDLTLAAATDSVNITAAEAVANAVLISATNAAGGITLDAGPTPGVTITNGTQSAQILVGTGSPDGIVTASQGSIFMRVNGAAGTSLYTNTDGAMAWSAV